MVLCAVMKFNDITVVTVCRLAADLVDGLLRELGGAQLLWAIEQINDTTVVAICLTIIDNVVFVGI